MSDTTPEAAPAPTPEAAPAPTPEDEFAAARLPDSSAGETVPLLRGTTLNYVAGVTIDIIYKDGRRVRIEGANLRVDAEVYLQGHPIAGDVQEFPDVVLPQLQNPKMHLVLQTTGQGTSTLTLKGETEPDDSHHV